MLIVPELAAWRQRAARHDSIPPCVPLTMCDDDDLSIRVRSVPEPRIYLGIAAGAPELSSCDIDIHNIWIRNLSAKKLQSLGSLLTKPPIVQTFVDMQPNFQCESCRTSSAVLLSLSMYINVTDGDLYG